MTIEAGQLRRWVRGAGEVGQVFLVIGFTEAMGHGDTTVDYIMDGELCWDDSEWVEQHSEVIDEG
jgi:hypothetical protein